MEETEARDRFRPLQGEIHEPLEGILGNASKETPFRPVPVRLTDPDDLVPGLYRNLVEPLAVREGAIRPGADHNPGDSRLSRIPASILVPVLVRQPGEMALDPRLARGGGRDRQSEEYQGRSHKNLQFSLRFRQAVW
jgi:hypothetical protein